MIRNYFKIAWRSLKKQPFFTFLNIFGLAIGMAGSLLICLYIYDELNHDNMFVDADRIYRINTDIKFGGEVSENSEVSAPLAKTVVKDIPQIEMATRFRNNYSLLIRKTGTDTNIKEEESTFVDESFLDMFGLDLIVGDPKTALKEPNTLILTKTAAEKHFSVNNALGQTLLLDNDVTYVVTGVINDLPKNSLLRNHSVFMSMASYADSFVNNWGNNNYHTFIKILPSAKAEDIQEPLQAILKNYILPFVQALIPGITEENFLASGNYYNFSIINIKDIHLHSNRFPELSPNGSIQNVYILSFIALFLIILASVNFMNLSTAQSLKRAKEVGIRKTLGSSKIELISQFLAESGLITFVSLIIAIIIAAAMMPLFNDLSGKAIIIPYTNPIFWSVLLLCTIVLGLFSGMYPAFFMSRFIPVEVLKGGGERSAGGRNIRSLLVVFQFAISVFLIVGTLVVFQQLDYIQSKDLGYTKDRVLVINDVSVLENQSQRESFKEQVQQLASVKSTSLSSFFPTPSNRNGSSFFAEGAMEQDKAIQMQNWRVDYDYVPTIDLEIIAGRDFDRQFRTDSLSTIINESAVRVLGVTPEEALGKRVTNDLGEENPTFYTVIGVVKNFHYESLRENIGALGMMIGDYSNALAVKINAGNYASTISSIESIWKTIVPGQIFDYYFIEEQFNATYKAEQRLGKIFITFTLLSILIACLGLFGLAAFNAEKRTKEIGIRKVLGANVSQITYKLSIDFLKLVGIAILVSLPLAWYAMSKWLEDFEYRIEMEWGVFALATFLAVTVSILTVSFQGIKAAIVNPIKSLRTE
ncbi:ABC transporter permease [Flavivirga spongiicola]|uniref:ABC transporter permease n=1 Tax=Flavivirga spongiicola TaxID=421621 RepID=A0ABU7XYA8_9FLAO|nr:ABC transporter permease [Flavivirga sp. MEBiC05379]MDO5980768.1 ABC transporter permease [Flavivirga sp. MEBiC05379]